MPAKFDEKATGLRKRGDDKGDTSLTVASSDAVEAYWSVEGADMIQLMRDDKPQSDPDRAADGCCPVPIDGLDKGDYTFVLVPGNAGADGKEVWARDQGFELKLTVAGDIAVNRFWADPEPDDDNLDHPPASLQIAKGHQVKLQWEVSGADKVVITATPDSGSDEELPEQDAGDGGKGSFVHDPKDTATSYKLTAKKDDANVDAPGAVEVHFHDAGNTVSPHLDVQGDAAATIVLYTFDQKPDSDPGAAEISVGADDNIYLKWSANAARSVKLTGKLLVDKDLSGEQPGDGTATQADNLAIVKSGLDLPVNDGAGSGVVTIEPGPGDSTEYTITVTPLDDKADPVTATAKVNVANFNVHVQLQDGSPAQSADCVLEVPGQDAFKGTTNEDGELWLSIPNFNAPSVTLRLLDKDGSELGSWDIELNAEDGVKAVVIAGPDKPDDGTQTA
ncbi:MAG TPA: hypothetical protein VLW85_18540 [Myxococcales bacterium]|nr:hypothetical protein [Myxococcales bacterium]